jgi:alkylation response protein AidB-like acyl-CoA dehydrogenase
MSASPIDPDELLLVRASMRHVLDAAAPGAMPQALLDEGWADLLAADPATAITTLAEEAGRARSAAPVLDLAMAWGAGLDPDAEVAVIADGLVLAGAERATRFMDERPSGIRMVPAEQVVLTAVAGFDPALGLARAEPTGSGEPVGDAEGADRSIACGRRALASQMVGAVEQMLADTVAYVNERHQYGRPIGSFQSVKHRLAEVKVAASAAKAACSAAWEARRTPDGSTLAIAAKCLAGRAQQMASTHCFQVHGGIAFTVEHGFNAWVRRGMLLDLLLGPHAQLTPELGRRLIAAQSVPRAPALRIV